MNYRQKGRCFSLSMSKIEQAFIDESMYQSMGNDTEPLETGTHTHKSDFFAD